MTDDWSQFFVDQPEQGEDDWSRFMVDQPAEEDEASIMDRFLRKDVGVDYDSGINDVLFRAGLNAMDTPEERQQYLNSAVGEGGWRQDSAGRYLVTADAARDVFGQEVEEDVAIDEFGLSRGDLGDILPDALPIAGAVGAGLAASGYGAAVGIPLAAAGAAGGKLLEEYVAEPMAGLPNLQSDAEIMGDVGTEAALAATGEGAFRMLAPVGRFILGPNAWKRGAKQAETFFGTKLSSKWATRLFGKLGDVQPSSDFGQRKLSEEIIERGGTPSVFQASRSMIAGRLQAVGDLIFGNELQTTNYRFVKRQAAALTRDLRQRAGGTALRGAAGSGAIIKRAASQLDDQAAAALQGLDDAAFKTLDDIEKLLRIGDTRGLTTGAGDTANLARLGRMFESLDPRQLDELIRTGKAQGANYYSQAYGVLDDMLGNRPIVATNNLKAVINEIADEIPGIGRAGELPGQFSEIDKLLKYIYNQDDVLTFKQAQTLRTMILNTLDDPKLIGTGVDRYKAMMLKAVDDMMGSDSLEKILTRTSDATYVPGTGLVQRPGFTILQPARIPVVVPDEDILKAISFKGVLDRNYASWIQRYDNALVRRLGLDAATDRAGNAVFNGKATDLIMRAAPHHVANLRRVLTQSVGRKPLSLNAWDRVRADVFKRMTGKVFDETGEKVVAPGALARAIENMSPRTFREIFGEASDDIIKLSKDMMLMGKTPPNLAQMGKLSPGALKSALNSWRRAETKRQRLNAGSLLSRVTKGSVPDSEVVGELLANRNKRTVVQVKNMLGKESPEWAAVQEEALTQILDKIYVPGADDGVRNLIKGQGLQKYLSKYSNNGRDKQALYALFGKDLTDDLFKFADMTSLLTTKMNMAGGLVAASIALHPLRNLPRLTWMRVVTKWMQTPGALNYYMNGVGWGKKRGSASALARSVAQLYLLIDEETQDDPWRLSLADDENFTSWIPNEQADQTASP